MKKLLQRVLQYEKILLVSAIMSMLIVGAALATGLNDAEADTDLDGVADSADMCPGTAPDRPTDDLGTNRYIWIAGGSEYFWTLAPVEKGDKNRVQTEFTILQTKGCSCQDILNVEGSKKGLDTSAQAKFGCTKNTIQSWINGK